MMRDQNSARIGKKDRFKSILRYGIRYGIPSLWFALFGIGLLLSLSGCSKKGLSPIIGIITDYGSNDAYIAQLKGSIYSINPQAQVVDLVENLGGYEVRQEAYLVDQAAANFKGRVIFVVVVNASNGAKPHPPILVRTHSKKFYVAPDNGVLSFVIAREGLDKAWSLDKPEFYRPSEDGSNFQGPDIIGPIAARLTIQAKPEELGTEIKTIEMLSINPPHKAGQTVGGDIVHIDSFGNLITNIPINFVPWLKEGNLLRFTLGKQTFNAPLVTSPNELTTGKYAAVYTSQGRLEIIVNKGSAARVFNVAVGDSFIIHP